MAMWFLLLAAGWADLTWASIPEVGFRNPYYQAVGYFGSRVLEHNQTGRFQEYMEASWPQAVTVSSDGRMWAVDRVNHQVLMMEGSTRYVPWPALYKEYAGTRGVAGHLDGMRTQALFNGPSGLVISDVAGSLIIFVADTNNHCIRRLDFASGRIATIAGNPRHPGLRDGPALQSRFRYPASIGIDASGENLFILDDVRRVRWLQYGSNGQGYVTTLVHGACRASQARIVVQTVVIRTVGCHTDWRARDTGDTAVELFEEEYVCVGHYASCGPRNHPALADDRSLYLQARPPAMPSAQNTAPTPAPVSRRLVNALPPQPVSAP